MAVSATLLSSLSDTSDLSAYSVPAPGAAPTANQPCLLAVCSSETGSAAEVPVIAGCALAWSLVKDFTGPTVGVAVFLGIGAAPTATAVSITYTIQHEGCLASFVQFLGTDGADPIRQAAENHNNDVSSIAVTLAAFGDDANNAVFGAFGHEVAEGATPEGGYTELHDLTHATPNRGLMTAWKVGQDLDPSASWTTSGKAKAVACEIKASGASSSGGSTLAAVRRRRRPLPLT